MPHGVPLARFIDHTLLAPNATAARIDRLCDEAREHGFFAVCVQGVWVARCAARLAGSGVIVAAVAGFPLGGSATRIKVAEAEAASEDGAREIDVVIQIGALVGGDDEFVLRDVRAVAEACRARGARLKAILETALLDDEQKVRAAELCAAAGAQFVKTSTGFAAAGANVHDIALLARTVSPALGVKASGGIRDARTARALLAAGATRLGTSASCAIVREDDQRS